MFVMPEMMITSFMVMVTLITASLVIIFLLQHVINNHYPTVYLINFACYKPPNSELVSKDFTINDMKRYVHDLKDETLDCIKRAIERIGIGDSTYSPRGLLAYPPNTSLAEARSEAQKNMFGAVDGLLAKTMIDCSEIDILIVNTSVFNTEPSLSSMVVKNYKFGSNVLDYNLTGMGCSAGLIAIGLANRLLKVHKNSRALVISAETFSSSVYQGNDISKLMTNLTFRVGGTAILLSNKPSDKNRSKYQLIRTVQNNEASSDIYYGSIMQEEDDEDNQGISIRKNFLSAGIQAIETKVKILAPTILPLSEKIHYLKHKLLTFLHMENGIRVYIPNLKKGFDHFVSHVGGKPVLDGLQRSLKLTEEDMEASRKTLYRFGNTSSSSVWYGLAYLEAKGKMKKGDRVWQISFGSGFKCCSVIWKVVRIIEKEDDVINPWTDVELDGLGGFAAAG
ncbi:3-ketoacyl-CoA synthase 11-like [Impatiens glandulifera]|uniref:3-ketoacyl-CoA synthase 11-like n=1 Tax=Impatiens glandulifera TaxID=253017 RepID=UPI001FB10A43|nr:3-ketoacyl-CoA synthase 11-like [Impatiens glandulifera]